MEWSTLETQGWKGLSIKLFDRFGDSLYYVLFKVKYFMYSMYLVGNQLNMTGLLNFGVYH